MTRTQDETRIWRMQGRARRELGRPLPWWHQVCIEIRKAREHKRKGEPWELDPDHPWVWRPVGQRLIQLFHLGTLQRWGIIPRPEDHDPAMRKLIALGFIDPEDGYRFDSRDLTRYGW